MMSHLCFLLSIAWFLLLATMLNWSQLDAGETNRMLILAVLPLAGGLLLKRAARYVARGE
jgi:hypothetical protein